MFSVQQAMCSVKRGVYSVLCKKRSVQYDVHTGCLSIIDVTP